jgi:hypothetical protein
MYIVEAQRCTSSKRSDVHRRDAAMYIVEARRREL